MKQIISGKVRDVYEINNRDLVIVTTDRISAFDIILNSMIPGKGAALNRISAYWFRNTQEIVPNHLISTDLSDMPAFFSKQLGQYGNRVMLVKKLRMLPYEFIVRGGTCSEVCGKNTGARARFAARRLTAGTD